MSTDLSSEALGERGKPWRRRRPSLPENDIDSGGLQSLAAAEPIKTQLGPMHCCGKTKPRSSSAAPRDRTPSRVSEKSKLGRRGGHPSLKSDIDLEGCSPLQPWNHKGPTLGPCLVGKTKLSSFSAAPRDRTPSRSGRNQNWDGTDVSAEALAKAEAIPP